MSESTRILRLDASANPGESASRALGDRLIERLDQTEGPVEIIARDLHDGLPPIDRDWIGANFEQSEARSPEQRESLRVSDELIEELESADRVVLTTPMYNFGVPSTLKAWIDLVCRAGKTFRYTAAGPEGLLDDRQVNVIITTGGVPLGSDLDFVSGYLKQIFNFIGIEDVNIIAADRMNVDADRSYAAAARQIDRRFAAAA